MDIDKKVKIEVLFKNNSMREKCFCGCKITKLNKDECTLEKCNNKECNFNHSKFVEYIQELKKQRREERNNRLIKKYDKVITRILWILLCPIVIRLNIYHFILI